MNIILKYELRSFRKAVLGIYEHTVTNLRLVVMGQNVKRFHVIRRVIYNVKSTNKSIKPRPTTVRIMIIIMVIQKNCRTIIPLFRFLFIARINTCAEIAFSTVNCFVRGHFYFQLSTLSLNFLRRLFFILLFFIQWFIFTDLKITRRCFDYSGDFNG